MRITDLRVYRADLPILDETYKFAGGKGSEKGFDTTVVELLTDSGIKGYGECCPLGCNYLPSYPAGLRAGLAELRPSIIGLDPLGIDAVNSVMDYQLKGHPYVKAAVDVALWDIAGKFAKLPVCTLLGGRFGDPVPLYRPIGSGSVQEMVDKVLRHKRTRGYRRFQLKVGVGSVAENVERIRAVRSALEDSDLLVADANMGWLAHEAVRVCRQVSDLDVYIEQPCASIEECARVRQFSSSRLPFILDESVDSVSSLLEARSCADVVNLKVSKVGGLTKARRIRDLCVELGIAMIIEDTWGSDFVTATVAHLAQSTPPQWRLMSSDFNSWHSVHVGVLQERMQNDELGVMTAPAGDGLGVQPDFGVLQPVL